MFSINSVNILKIPEIQNLYNLLLNYLTYNLLFGKKKQLKFIRNVYEINT